MTQSVNALEERVGTFKTSDGLDLHYVSRRDPAVPPQRLVVTIHGFADHSGRIPFLVDHLARRGAAVYSYDQRGNGKSPGQRGHVMAYRELGEDFDAFLTLATETEPGLERVVFGHSTGGILAMLFAIDHPQRMDRLILSAPALILTYEPPKWKELMGRTLSSILPRVSLNAGFDPGTVSRDEAVVAANKDDPLVTQAISTRFYHEVYNSAAPNALARIEELKVPLLVIQGTGDRLVSPRVADEFERRSTGPHEVKRYDGAYHETFNDIDREQVFMDIDGWLEKPISS
ncbi:MAG: lysophospholipase [Candidatus Dormibacteria bacterium]